MYIIECGDGTFYTGITTDVSRRFEEHQKGLGGHYTSAKKAVKVVYSEIQPDRSSALKRELEIKSLTRENKLRLVQSYLGNSSPS